MTWVLEAFTVEESAGKLKVRRSFKVHPFVICSSSDFVPFPLYCL